MKKKLLVLSSYPANYRVAAIEGLGQAYDLTIFFSTNKNEDRNPEWFVKNKNHSFYLMNTPEGKKAFRKLTRDLRQYDLIFAYDWSMKWALATLVRARISGVPYILNSDGSFPVQRAFPKEQIKRFFVSGAAAWVVSGEYAENNFLHYGADKSRIFRHNFTSLHREDVLTAPVSAADKTALREELGLPEKTTFLSIGQFIERKGFDILLEGWRQSRQEDSQLVIIGGGGKKPEYETQIQRDGLQNVILTDFVPFEKVWDYYKASDAFVLATREDIWGLVVNESMACGIPVMTSDRCIAGLELIENGKNGFIIENNAPEIWAKRIDELAADAALREQMGNANLKKIRDWCLEDTTRIDLQAIESVLA
ncbi:MAG: glycosyltransferase family 4 protein [Oscillospiraceae bacterium]|nr:glycosyltransferase family 4 protein [Oscillospiraceae bacterium]